MLLLTLSVAASGGGLALAQDSVYAARRVSNDETNWDAPFYWIDLTHTSAYGTSPYKSAVTSPVGTPTRAGSYYRTARLIPVGEGFGLVHVNGTQANAVYEVYVTQPYYQVSTTIIMNVGSTNCDIGQVFGATEAGGWTNTTAFQAAYSKDQWGRVCYLTNRPGITQPHVDFRYVSSDTTSYRNYADCVWFHQIGSAPSGPTPVRIARPAGTNLDYTGGSGARFILLQSEIPTAPLTNWLSVATNTTTPSSFAIPAVGTGGAAFYVILSE